MNRWQDEFRKKEPVNKGSIWRLGGLLVVYIARAFIAFMPSMEGLLLCRDENLFWN